MRRLTIIALGFVMVAACGGSDDASSTTTTTSTSSTSASTTTSGETTSSTSTLPPTTATTYAEGTTVTTFPAAFASPLNGLPATDDLNLDRRAIGVKIDNHFRARPQSGVMDADLVVETRVEAGLTRLIAFFHDHDSDYLGPIRSVRPTDSTIAARLDAPLVISGGQDWIQSLIASRGVGLVGPGAADLFRVSGRQAPHNLYGSTLEARAGADAQGYDDTPPPPLYEIGTWEYPSDIAESITMDWSDEVTVVWDYDPADKRYYREQDGVPHETITRDGVRTQISAEVLVVLAGEFYTAFPPGSGSAVPAIDTAGSGPAWVFARGRVWQGLWQRAQYDDPFALTSPDGSSAVVPPGEPWVSVFPQHRTISW
jgi:hypothetical protein